MTTERAARHVRCSACLFLLLLAFLLPTRAEAERVRIRVFNYSPHPVVYCLANWHLVGEHMFGSVTSYRSHFFEVSRPATALAPGMARLSGTGLQDVAFDPGDGSSRVELGTVLCFDNEDDRSSYDDPKLWLTALRSFAAALTPGSVEVTAQAVEYALYEIANGRGRPDGVEAEDVAGLIGGAQLWNGTTVYIRGRIAPSLVGEKHATEVLRRELELGINASFPPAFVDVTGEGWVEFCRSASDPGGATQIVCAPGGSNGFAFGASSPNRPDTDAGHPWFPQTFVDVDGDKRADFCRLVGNAGRTFIACDLAADHFGGASQYAYRSKEGIDLGYDWFPRAFADVDGDGRADFCRLVGDPHTPFIACNLAGSHGFGDDPYAYRTPPGLTVVGERSFPQLFADVNGDGRADFCGLVSWPKQLVTCLLAGSDGFDRGHQHVLQGGDLGYDWFPRVFVDVNGDRRADFCRLVGNPGETFIACTLVGGPPGPTPLGDQYEYRSRGGIDLGVDKVFAPFPRAFVDVNRDGRADFVRLQSAPCKPSDCLVWTLGGESGFESTTRSSVQP